MGGGRGRRARGEGEGGGRGRRAREGGVGGGRSKRADKKRPYSIKAGPLPLGTKDRAAWMASKVGWRPNLDRFPRYLVAGDAHPVGLPSSTRRGHSTDMPMVEK